MIIKPINSKQLRNAMSALIGDVEIGELCLIGSIAIYWDGVTGFRPQEII